MDPVFLDLDRLKNGRRRLVEGDTLLAALDSLAQERDRALCRPPVSVCDKPTPAPSGDLHDFLSIPTYYWPDPSKPDGLPWILRDCQFNPAVAFTDVARFMRLVDTVEILTMRAWYCADEEAGRRAVELVRVWFINADTRMNPSLQYSAHLPGEAQGRHWGVIHFQRAYLLLDLVAVLRACGAPLLDADVASLRDWFGVLRCWLLESEHGLDERRQLGNHGTWFDVQVVAYSLFLGDDDAARRWIETVTVPRLMQQIDVDGRQPHELGRLTRIQYAVFNLFGLVVLAEMGVAAGADLWRNDRDAARRIARAIEWLVPYLDAQLPVGPTTKRLGTFTLSAEAAMTLRIAGDRLDRDDFRDLLTRFVLHRPSARANLTVPPVAGAAVAHEGSPRASSDGARSDRRRRPVEAPAYSYGKVFVVGCPRSGTGWTRDILGRHPLTIVGPESHLFGQLFVPLVADGTARQRRRRTLKRYDESLTRLGAGRGPQLWIDRRSLKRALRDLEGSPHDAALRVIDRALGSYFEAHGGTPGRLLVEKTPHHLFRAERILARWPEAKIVEVLRDGRDVVTSLGKTEWAPSDRRVQVKQWTDAVEHGMRLRRSPDADGRWHVVRFEALKSQPRDEIEALFRFLDLPWDEALVRDIAIETEFARMQQSQDHSTSRRRGIVGDWRTELTDEEIALVEDLAGPTLEAAGY